MKTLLIMYCIILSSYSYANNKNDSHNLTTINLRSTQQTFSIALAANLTTGYIWTLKSYDPKYIKFLTSRYVPTNPQLIGSGGTTIFNFMIKHQIILPQQTLIRFVYARPWLHGVGSVKTVVINFAP